MRKDTAWGTACAVPRSPRGGYMVAMDLGPEARYKDVRCEKYERGYMVALDLGPEARYKDVRCVKSERSASK
eukprot:jgi/Astpho2/186/Aster-04643